MGLSLEENVESMRYEWRFFSPLTLTHQINSRTPTDTPKTEVWAFLGAIHSSKKDAQRWVGALRVGWAVLQN